MAAAAARGWRYCLTFFGKPVLSISDFSLIDKPFSQKTNLLRSIQNDLTRLKSDRRRTYVVKRQQSDFELSRFGRITPEPVFFNI